MRQWDVDEEIKRKVQEKLDPVYTHKYNLIHHLRINLNLPLKKETS